MKEDRKYAWHPFTQVKIAPEPVHIVRGYGTLLYDAYGQSYIDVNSSWWVNLHGHCHSYMNAKINEQLEKLEHVIFTDFTHSPAIELAERLIKLNPHMGKVFFTDNGSTANEAALKIAFQYWHNKGLSDKKRKVICFKNGYHGDTIGAMSSSGKTDFNKPFRPYLFESTAIEPPIPGKEELSIQSIKEVLELGDASCFIFEPLVQGVAGMRTHNKKALETILSLCKEHEVITIADEIMTGFGRTGPLFVSDNLAVKPDIMTLSKGITGGYLPLGATLCKEWIYEAFVSEDRSKAFLHGHSYCANPIACSAALASLDLLENERCAQQRKFIENNHKTFLKQLKGHPFIKRTEVLGTLFALEYNPPHSAGYFSFLSESIKQYYFRNGIICRPLGNVFYLNPPYCITQKELDQVYNTIETTLENPLWTMKL